VAVVAVAARRSLVSSHQSKHPARPAAQAVLALMKTTSLPSFPPSNAPKTSKRSQPANPPLTTTSLASSELADEMSSSSLVQTSVTPPSRRLSNVPGLSISSSPSRMQPHVPHVRSRLSTQSIAEEISSEKGRKPEREVEEEDEEVDEDDSDDEEPFIFQQDNI
jgi:hypothetical protein